MIGYLKLGAALAVVAVVVTLVVIVNGWRKDAAQVPVLEDRIEQANAQIEAERLEVTRVQNASKGYQDELATLKAARAAAPAPGPIRLCVVPSAPAGASTRPGEPGPDGSPAGAGQLPQGDGLHPGEGPGPDISADLYAHADRADDVVAQCRGLQALERARAGQPGAEPP